MGLETLSGVGVFLFLISSVQLVLPTGVKSLIKNVLTEGIWVISG